MTGASHDVFVDRRSPEERSSGLATQVLFWYDKDRNNKRGRTRTNAIAITQEGFILVARATCSRKDRHVKFEGRKIARERLVGHDKAVQRRPADGPRHSFKLNFPGVTPPQVGIAGLDTLPSIAAQAYLDAFPGDEMGSKRAFNVGKIFMRYREDIEKRAALLEGS